MADPTTNPPPTTTPNPNNPLGQDVGSIISFIQGLLGTANSNASTIANVADPTAGVRQQGIDQFAAFMKDPTTVLQDPLFKASLDLGLDSVSRQQGAAGGANSGGKLAALENYGQTAGYNAENTKFNQLIQMMGLGNPVARANILNQGNQNQSTNMASGITGITNMIAQMLGLNSNSPGGGGVRGLIQKIQQMLNGGGTGSDITPPGTIGSTGLNSPAGSPDLIPGGPPDIPDVPDPFADPGLGPIFG